MFLNFREVRYDGLWYVETPSALLSPSSTSSSGNEDDDDEDDNDGEYC
jgi:hypothetical protein